jgi:hypothetical protein
MNNFDPKQFDKNIYLEALKEKNLNSLKSFWDDLNNLFLNDKFVQENRENFLLTTTWSDWRLSNLMSEKEVILYHNSLSEDFVDYLQDKILNIWWVNVFEEKKLDSWNILNAWGVSTNILNRKTNLSKTDAIWPSVLIDSYWLYWNNEIQNKVDSVLYWKVQENRKVLDDSKKKTRAFRKIANTWKNILRWKEITHFDKNSWISYYNPDNFAYWFKMWPARLVQMKMTSEIISFLRKNNELDSMNFLKNLPNDNKSRLLFFQEMWISNLSEWELSELIEFFSMFMLLSHKSQYNYKINNIIETEFDKNETNDALESLVKITEKWFIK